MSGPDRVLAAVQLLAGAVVTSLVVMILVFTDRGFDITDEGFYLNSISQPTLWDASVTQFGFVYHPLYAWFDGDIALLRRVTVLMTLALSGSTVLAALGRVRRGWPLLVTLSVCTVLAGVGLRVYDEWLLTPSYNTLAFQGALLVATGLMLWWDATGEGRSDHESARTWQFARLDRLSLAAVLLGLGGVALFLAKPPAAAATAALVAATLIAGGVLRVRPTLVAVTCAVAVLAVFTIAVDGSPVSFVDRLSRGAGDVTLLEGGHSLADILRVDSLGLRLPTLTTGVGAFSGVALLTWSLTSAPRRRARAGSAAIGIAAFAGVVFVTWLRPGVMDPAVPAAVLVPLSIPLGGVAVRLAWLGRRWKGGALALRGRRDGILIMGLLLLPLAATLGTNSNTWVAASQLMICWIAAALVALRPVIAHDGWPVLTATAATTAVLVSFSTIDAMQDPYRQSGSVWGFRAGISVTSSGSIDVSAATAEAVAGLQSIAIRSAMPPGTAVLDLTGYSPGLVFALQGIPVNSPWVPGGYPGSDEVLRRTIDRLSCDEVVRGWLLIQPGGPRSIDENFFVETGSRRSDYVMLGSVTPPRASGDSSAAPPPIMLLRDTRDSTAAATECRAARYARG